MAYIEVTARFERQARNGEYRKVTEHYICRADTCAEAEAMTLGQISLYNCGQIEVTASKKAGIAEVFNADSGNVYGKFYLVKVAFVTIDEKTAKEKRAVSQILVGAEDFNAALAAFNVGMAGTVADFEVLGLALTPFKEFYTARP